MEQKHIKAFTLIELLIVVAIIAILAAIAVPNFLEAQTRAKISRVKNDLRAISVGAESFVVDNNRYPNYSARWMNLPTYDPNNPTATVPWQIQNIWTQYLYELTTPVAFMSTMLLKDPFMPKGAIINGQDTGAWMPSDFQSSYAWIDYSAGPVGLTWTTIGKKPSDNPSYNVRPLKGYCMTSWGPNRMTDGGEWALVSPTLTGGFYEVLTTLARSSCVYDATNGTVSPGDIVRYGGEIPNI